VPGWGEQGVGEEPNQNDWREKAWSSINHTLLPALGCEGRRKKTYNILGHNVGLEQRELPPFGMLATDS
jgi:hypothetical protein